MEVISDYVNLLINQILVAGFGWILFLILLIYMLYKVHIQKKQKEYEKSIEQVFLEVKVEELNERSPLAMEQVFAALHAMHQNFTWGERFNGKQVLWLSCEIVSLGGRVSFIFKIPKRFRNLLESAVFAQYPKAEIYEVQDYLKNLPDVYDPVSADFEFWGTQMNKKKNNAYPIRTYGAFEHPEQETIIDALANVIEVMSNIAPHELMASQIVIKPIDEKWKENVKLLLDKLKGAPEKHSTVWFEKLVYAIPSFMMDIIVTHVMGVEKGEAEAKHNQNEPPSQMLHKTEGEKQVIASVEHGLTKLTYKVKIRLFYLAPKDKFNKQLRVPEIIGAYRNFEDVSTNALKPDIAHTWTDKAYKVSEKVEQRLLDYLILMRKRHMLHNFRQRSNWRGTGETYLNTEELATLFHFPQSPNVRVSQVERVQTVKSAPPQDLPIGQI